MYSFRSVGGAKFSYSVNFSDVDFANISFFDRSKKNIIFHLSLRQATGLAVANARRNDEWQGEIPEQVDLSGDSAQVTIAFFEETITVTLDGTQIFQFEGVFAGADAVQYLHFTGGLIATSFVLEGDANQDREGHGELTLSDGLAVQGWAADPGLPQQVLHLEITNLHEPILFRRRKLPEIAARFNMAEDGIGIQAPLPGRVWLAAGEGRSITLSLSCNGIACGDPLHLTKADIVQRIETLAQGGNVKEAMFDLLLALEHVHFGKLWGALSGPAKLLLRDVAETYGTQDFLEDAENRPVAGRDTGEAAPGADKAPVQPPRSPDDVLLQRARRTFGARLALTDTPDHFAILDTILSKTPLPPHVVRNFLLAVTDEFCSAGAFEDLFRYSAVRGHHDFARTDSEWHNSVILPFLCMQGRLDEVRDILWSLKENRGGWLATPALGWSIRYLLRTATGPGTERQAEEILYALIALIDTRNRGYWARMMCAELIEATVAMILDGAVLADLMRTDIARFALRNYGLSQMFWERLDARIAEMAEDETRGETGPLIGTGNLDVGRRCFRALQDFASGDTTTDIEPALSFFEACQNPDTERFRLELLGPTGLNPDQGPALPENLLLKGRNVSEGVLRAMAFPGAAENPAPNLPEITRAGIRARHTNVPKAPHYDLQVTCGREATAFLAALAKDGSASSPDAAQDRLQAILDKLSTLSSERSRYLGLGLSLSLFNALLTLGEETLATLALAHVVTTRARIVDVRPVNLAEEPAIHAALTALAISAVTSGNALAQSGLAAFPGFDPTHPRGANKSGADETAPAQVSALFDTIITVFSCRPYLDTRITAMREGWLGRLSALGIPYVVIVGDGDGRQEGDVLYLDAPDDYEGLPQKTLKVVEWVHNSTPYSYMLKIDDDCFLNAEEFFYSLSYRKFDYYGRRLERTRGQTDRTWHFAKSQSARGRMELDKSPEPSVYADGGNGYVLSRRAMATILREAQNDTGQTLIHASFMEDKLIGDLLSFGGIQVQEEDYYVSIHRRTYGAAEPVSMWQNSFLASRLSPMKQVHLDSEKTQAASQAMLDKSGLYPRKLWPTYSKIKLGYQTNLLELVSPEDKLEQLNREPVAVVACLRNEMFMLPHFLAHYRALGVKAFLMVDNCSDDGTLEYLQQQPDVALFSVDTSYNESQYGVAWQMALLANLRVGRWSLMADADELITYRGWETTPLPTLLAGADFADVDAVRVYMLDMYPKGPLSAANFDQGGPFAEAGFVDAVPFLRDSTGRGAFSDSNTVTSALRHRLLPGSRPELFVAQKYALLKYKPWMRPSAGLHYMADLKLADQEMIFAHFKYNAHFRAKAEAEVARGQHFNNAEEYRQYLALVSEGREVVFDADRSVHWMDSPEVQRILGG